MQSKKTSQETIENEQGVLPQLRGDQRFIFIGKTESGKSYLARYLLKLFREAGWRIAIVDPKKAWQGKIEERVPFGERGKLETVDSPVLVDKFDPRIRVQIIQPAVWGPDIAKFCKDVMEYGNTIIYFDEITQLVNANSVPTDFKVLWTQGRWNNIGAWAGTQRPKNVPLDIKDQAEVWFVFRTTDDNDRMVIGSYLPTDMHGEIRTTILPYRYFWYYNDKDDNEYTVKVRPLQIGKK